ncbi:HK97-gp10 family putative phage morphogenesis protein [Clostridium sp. BL-8]|uniref:HK97-gp10 family putative phage morphogenesis protein n=1 Tax=Clostridium sp. BL-8 TaxID=349938 RepID=UPI00098C2E97|nr:HK97-gp10 family putative phage morphogenesis protein [Clostridium sp. BL-8]OOM75499.1 hypothetical protein CLOBL_39890 [Clostridium sp. BL-8]
MSAEFKVDGLDSLLRTLQNIGKEGSLIEDESLVEAVEPILEDVQKTNLYKDKTGKLRKSAKISKVKKAKSTKTVWVGDIDRKANYGWYVEWGDSKRKPRPFMRQAYDRNKEQVYKNLKVAIQRRLKNK